MKSPYKLLGITMPIIVPTFPGSSENYDCLTWNQNFRTGRDTMIAQNENQPFSAQDIATFQGLFYYPVDSQTLQTVMLHRQDPLKVISVQTNRGQIASVYDYGTVIINLGGEDYSLQVYKNIDIHDFAGSETIFIPFKDETSGQTTFAHGRYLILKPGRNEAVLDFNMAINPWENYNSNYSTLLVPDANIIRAPVPTGERKYEDR